MTKTDYELTIGGKLRKVYKNNSGFFVKMNGGNLNVDNYFLKNGGGLKSKYRNKNKITGGYYLDFIKMNGNHIDNVKNFLSGFDPVEHSLVTADEKNNFFLNPFSDTLWILVNNIIQKLFPIVRPVSQSSDQKIFKYKINETNIYISSDASYNDDMSNNIRLDVINFAKMFLLQMYLNQTEENLYNNDNIYNNYKFYLEQLNKNVQVIFINDNP